MTNIRFVSIITGPDTHLDHLGVLSHLLDIPLIVTEPDLYELYLKLYPKSETYYIPLSDLSLDLLSAKCDVILESGKFWHMEMGPVIELLYQKKLHFVFCPHGNSDKGHSSKNHAPQDISLYYGEHMYDLLQKTKALAHIKKLIRTGNYRYAFYKKHKTFYQDIVKREIIPNLDRAKKTILYAPTWQDGENPTSFFSATRYIIHSLKDRFNLIIKLHPLLSTFHPAQTEEVLSHFSLVKGTVFLKEFPPIYPLLDISDIYLGDYSSVGYDFLSFDRPMFFLNKNEDYSALHSCGVQVPKEDTHHLYDFIIKNLKQCDKEYSHQRKKVYRYAFGEDRDYLEIKKELTDYTKEKARHAGPYR